MAIPAEDLQQIKVIVKEAVAEALAANPGSGGGVGIDPPDVFTIQDNGSVSSNRLAAYKQELKASKDALEVAFSDYVPDYVFDESFKTFPALTDRQINNISYNTNRARLTGGLLGSPKDFVFVASEYVGVRTWYGALHFEPQSKIENTASLPGSNVGGVEAVSVKDAVNIFKRLLEKYKQDPTFYIPAWVGVEVHNPGT